MKLYARIGCALLFWLAVIVVLPADAAARESRSARHGRTNDTLTFE